MTTRIPVLLIKKGDCCELPVNFHLRAVAVAVEAAGRIGTGEDAPVLSSLVYDRLRVRESLSPLLCMTTCRQPPQRFTNTYFRQHADKTQYAHF